MIELRNILCKKKTNKCFLFLFRNICFLRNIFSYQKLSIRRLHSREYIINNKI